MSRVVVAVILLVVSVVQAEELITFKNGQIGVNFGGYRAAAGLGGLLTGNAADGGLSASAGTPLGHHAAAGLGGSVAPNVEREERSADRLSCGKCVYN